VATRKTVKICKAPCVWNALMGEPSHGRCRQGGGRIDLPARPSVRTQKFRLEVHPRCVGKGCSQVGSGALSSSSVDNSLPEATRRDGTER
jgi:hypothetical protein